MGEGGGDVGVRGVEPERPAGEATGGEARDGEGGGGGHAVIEGRGGGENKRGPGRYRGAAGDAHVTWAWRQV